MSVRKRTWTNAKGEVHTAFVCDYADAQGVRRLKTFKLKKEASAFEATARGEIRDGTHVPDSASKTVAEAGALWLKTAEADKLERATLLQYRQLLNLHITPIIGGTLLSRLGVPTVRAFEDRLRAEDRSPAMVSKIMSALGSILADAQERGLVGRNVVREMRRRRHKGKERKAKARHNGKLRVGVDIPEPSEIKEIVNTVSGRWRPLLLTAIFAGLRASELRGLRWRNVHLDEQPARVHVCERADRYNEIGSPKSDDSNRDIPLSPIVVNTLKSWKRERQLQGLAKDSDFVFGNGQGKVESLNNIVRRGFQPTLIKAGVTVPVTDADGKQMLDKKGKPMVKAKYGGAHCYRHWFASWCLARPPVGLGLTLKETSERLGHSNITITADRYAHLIPRGDDAEALADAERALLA